MPTPTPETVGTLALAGGGAAAIVGTAGITDPVGLALAAIVALLGGLVREVMAQSRASRESQAALVKAVTEERRTRDEVYRLLDLQIRPILDDPGHRSPDDVRTLEGAQGTIIRERVALSRTPTGPE